MVLEQPDCVCIAQGRALRHDSIGRAVFFFLLSQRFAHRLSRSRHVLPTSHGYSDWEDDFGNDGGHGLSHIKGGYLRRDRANFSDWGGLSCVLRDL